MRLKAILLLTFLLVISAASLNAQDAFFTSFYAGLIDNDNPFHEYRLTVQEDNSDLLVDLRATSGDLDTVLYLVDNSGAIIAESDDRARDDTNSLLDFRRAVAGDYTLIATRFDVQSGQTAGDFELNGCLSTDYLNGF